MLQGQLITLTCVYGPNVDAPDLFAQVWHQIINYGHSMIVWGSDFNIIFNPPLDCSQAVHEPHPFAVAQLRAIMEDHGLIDIWRERCPGGKMVCVSLLLGTRGPILILAAD